jgi:hypothetical protein
MHPFAYTRNLLESLRQIFRPVQREGHTVLASTFSERVSKRSELDTPTGTRIQAKSNQNIADAGYGAYDYTLHLVPPQTVRITAMFRKQSKLET